MKCGQKVLFFQINRENLETNAPSLDVSQAMYELIIPES